MMMGPSDNDDFSATNGLFEILYNIANDRFGEFRYRLDCVSTPLQISECHPTEHQLKIETEGGRGTRL